MARLWTNGFELNSIAMDTNVAATGSPTLSTTTVRSGVYSLRTNPTSASHYISHNPLVESSAAVTYYFRTYIYIATLPSATTTVIRFRGSGTTYTLNIKLTTTGALQFFGGATQLGSDSSALSTGTWYRIEIAAVVAGSAQTHTAKIDGTNFATGSYTQAVATGIDIGVIDATTADLFFDDIAFNDNAGTDQASYPGSGKVVNGQPDASGDNNAWLKSGGGAGTTTNYQDVDELTPDDATTYLKTSANGVLDDYNAQSSSTMGIGANDSISVVHVGIRYNSVNFASLNQVKARLKATSGGTTTTGSTYVAAATNTWYNYTTQNAQPMPLGQYSVTSYTKPGGSNVWTPADIDSMQIGMESVWATTGTIQVSTVFAVVEYVPGAAVAAVNKIYKFNQAVKRGAYF